MKIILQRQLPNLRVQRFRSTGGSFDGAPPALNTFAARPCNCRFHSVIWFGCTLALRRFGQRPLALDRRQGHVRFERR